MINVSWELKKCLSSAIRPTLRTSFNPITETVCVEFYLFVANEQNIYFSIRPLFVLRPSLTNKYKSTLKSEK